MKNITFWALVAIALGSAGWGFTYGDCSEEGGRWVLFGFAVSFITLCYSVAMGVDLSVRKDHDKDR